MSCYAGLDVSLEMTSICIVAVDGKVLREGKALSEPGAVVAFLRGTGLALERVGLEAGALSEWLAVALEDAGFPVVCMEARQVKAALSAMTVKTDRHDARGIAQIARTGWFKAVHVKSAGSQELRTLLGARRHLVRKVADGEQLIRGLLRPLGLKVGPVTRRRFAERIRELLAGKPTLQAIFEPLLDVQGALMLQLSRLHLLVLRAVRDDAVCRRLTTMPGVGPVIALTYRAAVDDPQRFRRSRSVGAYLGLTPRKYQSGEVDRTGRISKAGDGDARAALFEAANVALRPSTRWSGLKAWAMQVAKRQGSKRAKVALARKMACVLHRMWTDGTDFRWTTDAAAA
jgi:transposase